MGNICCCTSEKRKKKRNNKDNIEKGNNNESVMNEKTMKGKENEENGNEITKSQIEVKIDEKVFELKKFNDIRQAYYNLNADNIISEINTSFNNLNQELDNLNEDLDKINIPKIFLDSSNEIKNRNNSLKSSLIKISEQISDLKNLKKDLDVKINNEKIQEQKNLTELKKNNIEIEKAAKKK